MGIFDKVGKAYKKAYTAGKKAEKREKVIKKASTAIKKAEKKDKVTEKAPTATKKAEKKEKAEKAMENIRAVYKLVRAEDGSLKNHCRIKKDDGTICGSLVGLKDKDLRSHITKLHKLDSQYHKDAELFPSPCPYCNNVAVSHHTLVFHCADKHNKPAPKNPRRA